MNVFKSALLGLIAVVFFSPPVGSGGAIPVAAVFSLTGRASGSNLFDLRGVNLAVKEINAAGGVLGKEIQLMTFDNQSTLVGSSRAAKEAIAKGVVAIVGASWSDHSLVVAPLAEKARIPMISTYSTNPRVTQIGKYIFRVCYLDTFQAKTIARFARQDLKLSKVVTLYESGNEYSEGLSRYFSLAFRGSGGTVLATLPYLTDSLDFSRQLAHVKELKPEAIFIPGYEKEVGLIIKQIKRMEIDAVLLGADGWGDTLFRYLSEPMKIAYEVKPWSPESPQPASRRFVEMYKKEYGADEPLEGAGAALGYDAVHLLADAIRRANSTESFLIRKALAETADFVGITGQIRFDDNGDPVKGAIINRYLNSNRPSYFTTINP